LLPSQRRYALCRAVDDDILRFLMRLLTPSGARPYYADAERAMPFDLMPDAAMPR